MDFAAPDIGDPVSIVISDLRSSFKTSEAWNHPNTWLWSGIDIHAPSITSGEDSMHGMDVCGEELECNEFPEANEALIAGGDEASVPSKKTKRQAQNRAAQRAFRERKEKTIRDLHQKLSAMDLESSTLRSENDELQRLLAEARTEIQTLRSISQPGNGSNLVSVNDAQVSSLEAGSHSLVFRIDLSGLSCKGRCGHSTPSMPTPSSIDFDNSRRTSQIHSQDAKGDGETRFS